ncbi:hypothetical protein ACW9YV_15420 (plasmid) [Paraburkholderia strydomiana]
MNAEVEHIRANEGSKLRNRWAFGSHPAMAFGLTALTTTRGGTSAKDERVTTTASGRAFLTVLFSERDKAVLRSIQLQGVVRASEIGNL